MEDVTNPANGEVIAKAPLSTKEDVDKAVKAARKAATDWENTTPGERRRMLLKLADAFEERGEEIADLESLDAGKPRNTTLEEEVPPMVDQLRFFARRRPLHGGQGRRRVHGGPHLLRPPRAASASARRSPPGTTR